ncbi:MAG: hypothetical protein ABMA26_09050 [Limisphaerales bacterium]
MNPRTEPPVCWVCRTTYRLDPNTGEAVVVRSITQRWQWAAIGFGLLASVGMASSNISSSTALFCAFVAYAIYYWSGWRIGVLSWPHRSNWHWLPWPRTLYQVGNPGGFRLTLFLQGFALVGLFFAWLISL